MPNTGVYTSLPELMALQALATSGGISAAQPPTSVLAGRRASRLRGRGMTFEELREYHPGDDVRHIDWRVTARTGRAHTRVYSEERERPVLLLVDQRLSMFFGTRVQMKSVTAAELAGLMAWQALQAGDRVGATIFNDMDFCEIDPHRSRKNVQHLFDRLVHYNCRLSMQTPMTPSASQLDAVLAGVGRRIKNNWLVVIISDFQGISDMTYRRVQQIARHNDVVAAFVHDPVAFDVPVTGKQIMTDGHSQAEFDFSDARTRAMAQQTGTSRATFLQQLRRDLGVPCLFIDTTGDVAGQLARALGGAKRTSGGHADA